MSPLVGEPPSSGNEFSCRGSPEAGGGRLRRWWAERRRVKLERERSDRSLRRWKRSGQAGAATAGGESSQLAGRAGSERGRPAGVWGNNRTRGSCPADCRSRRLSHSRGRWWYGQ